MLQLKLNPAIDVAGAARIYAESKCVQIPDLFEAGTADYLAKVIASLPWRFLYQNDADENVMLTKEDLAAMPADARGLMIQHILERAQHNIGYTYYTYPMIQAALSGWDRDHPIHALTEFLNSPPFLELARALIGCAGLTKTDAHATNYQRGHYLTRHIDDGERKERRAAYTLGFTRGWQPDWGGLLLFLNDQNDVIRGLLPRFNVLTVFDGLRVHSVSAVSPFAPTPRFSIAGWFRDDPAPQR
jgi:Rps23 Pro-64 3,4-dihydroxylase Tpa1-like proline 4-hydroxylase